MKRERERERERCRNSMHRRGIGGDEREKVQCKRK